MNNILNWLKNRLTPRWRKCTEEDPGIDAILCIVRIIARLVATTTQAIAPAAATGGLSSPISILFSLGKIAPDIVEIVAEYGDLPCEIERLNKDKYLKIVGTIIKEFGLTQIHAKAITDFAIKLISQSSKEKGYPIEVKVFEPGLVKAFQV